MRAPAMPAPALRIASGIALLALAAGWLRSFCTYQRGFSHGRAGQSYSGACPEALAAGFVAGYERGRELHGLHRRLGTVDKEIARIKAALKDGIPNPKTRSMEIERLEALTRESEQLQGAISNLQK